MATADEKTYRIAGKKRVWDMDRDEQTRFPFDWTAWLAKESEAAGEPVLIQSVEFVLSSNVTKVQGGFDTQTASVTVKFTDRDSPMDEDMETVTCRMTTNQAPPQIRDRTIYLFPVES